MKYLVQGQDILFNLAGQTSHIVSMNNLDSDLEINCRAQLSLLETCRKFNPTIKIFFASTRQLYGKPEYLPVPEKHSLNTVDINGIHKMAGECHHILFNRVYGVRACSLRLTNTIGPRMRIKDARQTFLRIWNKCILEGTPVAVWSGGQLRDFSYVDDVCEAFFLAAESEKSNGKIFNVGGTPPISLLDLAKLLIKINGKGNFLVKSFPSKRKIIDIGNYFSDDTKLHKTLGWKPRIGLVPALSNTLAYFRDNLAFYV